MFSWPGHRPEVGPLLVMVNESSVSRRYQSLLRSSNICLAHLYHRLPFILALSALVLPVGYLSLCEIVLLQTGN